MVTMWLKAHLLCTFDVSNRLTSITTVDGPAMKWFTLAFGILVLCIVAAANLGAARPVFDAIGTIPGGDKVCHFVLVGGHRGGGHGGGHDEREQTLNQLLVEMDGFEGNEGVIVIAATNRPDVLDPALLRPGRFDRQVVVPLPDVRGREAIIKVHMTKVPIDEDV